MNNLTDKELIENAQAGDDYALGIFLDRHRDSLKKYLVNETGLPYRSQAVEDLICLTEAKFALTLKKIMGCEESRAYLFKIAYNNTLDGYRKEKTLKRRGGGRKKYRFAGLIRKGEELKYEPGIPITTVPILNSAEAEIYEGICEEDL